MADYQLYAKVSGPEVDFELKRNVDSLGVLEKLAEICVDEKKDPDGLKPVLTPKEAYKHLKEGKGYRWFKQRFNCTKHQINGYKRWLDKNPSVVGKDEETYENSGINLYAKLNGGNVCIELRGKVASLDSVLNQIVSDSPAKAEPIPEKSPEAAADIKPALTYKIFRENYDKPNSWFTKNYNVFGAQLNGMRLALKRHNKDANNQEKSEDSKNKENGNSKQKQKLTKAIAFKYLEKGKDFEWFNERYDCSIMQLAGYKSWFNRKDSKRKK